MLKNYLKIAFRHLRKDKTHAIINLAGLALGLACAIIVLLNAKREYGVNHNFTHADRLFRISSQWREKDMGLYLTTLAPVGQLMKENLPEVKHFTRLWGGFVVLNVGGQAFREDMVIADTSYFRMFDFPFAAGDAQTALAAPNNVVITENLAQKCFGRGDVVGESITLQLFAGNGKRDFKITGVLKTLPRTSATHFGDTGNDIFISTLNLADFLDPTAFTSWDSRYIVTFVELNDGKEANLVQQQLAKLMETHCPPEIRQDVALVLDPITRVHLIDNENETLKNLRGQYVFALVMLLIACINFINLSTARSLRRAKEVGVRKVLGSQRVPLVKQFLLETFVLAVFALMLALALVEAFNVWLRPVWGNFPPVQLAADASTLALIVGVTLCTGLVAGFYPALFLSALKPASVLKAEAVSRQSSSWIRQALVVLQFGAAIFLIIAGAVVSQQLDFSLNRERGFNEENVLVIQSMPREWTFAGIQKQEAFRDRLQQVPGVDAAALCWDVPGGLGSGALELRSRAMASDQKVVATQLTVDDRYLAALDVPLVEGRFFAKEFFHADTANAIVINEAAAKALALAHPVGEQVHGNDGQTFTIVGVVKNFQFSMLERSDKPLALLNVYRAGIYRFMAVRLNAPNLPAAVSRLESFWKAQYPEVPFIFRFLDDLVQEQYAALVRLRQMSRLATVLALFVACIGLLGLAAYAAAQRTKEIGVRKVLGASVASIVALLSKEFVKLVVLANLLAWPIAYFALNRWLQDFAYRIEMGWWIFAFAGGAALLIALLTVSTQAIKAALANPVEALRYE